MRRRLLLCTGGGVVEGLMDSLDMDPRVRLAGRLGSSWGLETAFLSESLAGFAGTGALVAGGAEKQEN